MRRDGGGAGSVGSVLVALGAAFAGAVSPGALNAQTLAEDIARAAPATVTFSVALRDGVEVCERGSVRLGRDDETRVVAGAYRLDGDRGRCARDVAYVRVEQDARGRPLDLTLLPDPPGGGERSLGEIEGARAGEYLFALAGASTGAGKDVVRRSLMVTSLLEGFDAAPGLLGIATDRDVGVDARKAALFWVAQVASARVGTHLAGIAALEAEDQEVRDVAVFALSQRPADEAVPALADLARSAPHVKTRRSALFWLSQTDDPRVADLFAELILRGPLGEG